jgi:hypothetical protein
VNATVPGLVIERFESLKKNSPALTVTAVVAICCCVAAPALPTDKPGMTTLVSRLEDEGWVERRPDAGDGRVVNVAITKAGVAMLEKALAARTAVLQKRIELLGPKEKQALAAAAAALQTLTQDRPEVT